ncbi:hypothetical protein [Pseudomonas baetica]|uniref:hypothetical protein n=1 Tax=Pseudomonas baetica TaxID=674054 RepID=UPI00240656FF|nr:hypothetical protein [Pseudomonas baetica]MDF9778873.1 hypothetical protein [Pseudomonas baetica]
MNLNDTFETPKNLVGVLGQQPSSKSELLTYVANWKVYADFLVDQAKARRTQPNHPLNAEAGQQKFVAEVSSFQETYNQVSADLQRGKFKLSGDEMRRIGNHFSEANIVMEQAFAIHQAA